MPVQPDHRDSNRVCCFWTLALKMLVVLRSKSLTDASTEETGTEQKHRNGAFGQYTGNIPEEAPPPQP